MDFKFFMRFPKQAIALVGKQLSKQVGRQIDVWSLTMMYQEEKVFFCFENKQIPFEEKGIKYIRDFIKSYYDDFEEKNNCAIDIVAVECNPEEMSFNCYYRNNETGEKLTEKTIL